MYGNNLLDKSLSTSPNDKNLDNVLTQVMLLYLESEFFKENVFSSSHSHPFLFEGNLFLDPLKIPKSVDAHFV